MQIVLYKRKEEGLFSCEKMQAYASSTTPPFVRTNTAYTYIDTGRGREGDCVTICKCMDNEFRTVAVLHDF